MVSFEEYDEPFYISSVTIGAINNDALKSLSKGDVLKMYYINNGNRNYTYGIYEMKN